jgi:dTDP-4-amino-4,6-dideoxygalactose transaminase
MNPRHDFLPFGRPNFGDEEIDAVTRVLRSGWVGMGPETAAFEQDLADALQAAHVVTVNSCTSALFLSLIAAGIGSGDEVIVPSLTWISTANAVRYAGATPVFCDIDAGALVVTPASIRASLTPRTKAVIVVHLGGLAVDVDAIRRALPAHIAIIEDAAHAFGSQFAQGRPVGSSGNLTCFSFYANKNLATGEGGAIATEDPAIADRLRSLRQHALPQDAWKRYINARSLGSLAVDELGYKANYTDLQAAIGRVQLRRQPEFFARRLAIARIYSAGLSGFRYPIAAQTRVTDPAHARHLFLVQLPVEELGQTRNEILAALRQLNIGVSLHYQPIHTMPLYGGGRQRLPVTERVAERILTLPISASMSIDDAREVLAALDQVLASGPALNSINQRKTA